MTRSILIFTLAMLLFGCSSTVQITQTVTHSMNDLNGAQFLKGMSGAENIYLDNSTLLLTKKHST